MHCVLFSGWYPPNALNPDNTPIKYFIIQHVINACNNDQRYLPAKNGAACRWSTMFFAAKTQCTDAVRVIIFAAPLRIDELDLENGSFLENAL